MCIQPFLKINRDVSELVKFATRVGLVSYVGKVVAPGDWDNIIRNVILEAERINNVTIFTNAAISDVAQTNSQIYPCQTLG